MIDDNEDKDYPYILIDNSSFKPRSMNEAVLGELKRASNPPELRDLIVKELKEIAEINRMKQEFEAALAIMEEKMTPIPTHVQIELKSIIKRCEEELIKKEQQ